MCSQLFGGSVSISPKKDGESLSVLIPGQNGLTRRVLKAPAEHKLTRWFWSVEERAWDWVNANVTNRPDSIFLVTGQTLASEYAISHVEGASSSCAISFKASVKIPEVADLSFLFGSDVQSISASVGFEDVKKSEGGSGHSAPQFSIYIEIVPSGPWKKFSKSRHKEVNRIYEYAHYDRELLN
jgi:hypothetical protein